MFNAQDVQIFTVPPGRETPKMKAKLALPFRGRGGFLETAERVRRQLGFVSIIFLFNVYVENESRLGTFSIMFKSPDLTPIEMRLGHYIFMCNA